MNATELMRGRWSLTPVTWALIAANLAVFISMLANGAGWWHSPNDVQLAWGANFGPATSDGEWWRLATAMFVHFGLLHLALNMWALWDSCRMVERVYGHARFLAIYAAGGTAGNLCSLLVHGDRAISGGASGAIFSAYGALLVWLWRERLQIHPVEFRWLFGGAAAFAAAAIGMGLLIPGIDNAAHLGGLVYGVLIGRMLVRPFEIGSPRPGAGRWVAGTAALGLTVALFARVPAPEYRWRDEELARSEIREVLEGNRRIAERWQAILEAGAHQGASFEELAARIDEEIASEYQGSFAQLSSLNLDPATPSANAVQMLKRYAQLRGEASRALADAVRRNDRERIRAALEALRRAPYEARGEVPPPAP